MRFLVTRPQPDCRRTAEKLRALGHVVDEAPVLKTVEVRSAQFGVDGVSALAFSSRRLVAVLSAQGRIDALRSLPVFTVGDATALACREAGFSSVLSASGDIAALAQLILDNRSGLSSGTRPLSCCRGSGGGSGGTSRRRGHFLSHRRALPHGAGGMPAFCRG